MAIPSWYQAQISTTISAPTSIIKDIKHVMVSTIIGSTIQTNTLNVSSLSSSTIQGNALSITTLLGSTIQSNILNVSTVTTSTIQTSTLSFATLLGSTIQTNVLQYSTITGSSIQAGTLNVSSLIGSSIQTSTLTVSSLIGSSIKTNTTITSSLIGCTIETSILNISSSVISSIQLNILNISTLNSNISQLNVVYASTILGSTLIGSTFQINTLNVSSSIGSTIQTNIVQASTLTGSTIQTNSFIVSTMSITSTNAIKMNTLNTSTTIGSTITGSTIQTNQLGYYNDSISTVAFDINVSSIIGLLSTDKIQTNSLYFSTLTGSTINASTLQTTTLLGSTIINNRIQSDTLNVSSLSSNTIQINSISGNNILVSSIIQVNQINTSTIMGSTIFMNRLDTSTIVGSSIQASQMGVSTIIDKNTIQINTLNGITNVRPAITTNQSNVYGEYITFDLGTAGNYHNTFYNEPSGYTTAYKIQFLGSDDNNTWFSFGIVTAPNWDGSGNYNYGLSNKRYLRLVIIEIVNLYGNPTMKLGNPTISNNGGTNLYTSYTQVSFSQNLTTFSYWWTNGGITVQTSQYTGVANSGQIGTYTGSILTNFTSIIYFDNFITDNIIRTNTNTNIITGSTIQSNAILGGTLNVSSATGSTIIGSTIQMSQITISTIVGSTIIGSNFQTNKIMTTDGNKALSTSATNVSQLEYIAGLVSQAGGTGQSNTWVSTNIFYSRPIFNGLSTVIAPPYTLGIDGSYKMVQFVPNNQSLVGALSTNYTPFASAVSTLNNSIIYYVSTTDLAIGQTSSAIPTGTSTIFTIPGLLQTTRLYAGTGDFSKIVMTNKLDGLNGKVITDYQGCNFYSGRIGNNGTGNLSDVLYLNSWYNWGAPTFNTTDSFNVQNNIVVTSAGTGFVTMPSFTPSSTALTFSVLFTCTGSTMPANSSHLFNIGNAIDTPTRNFGIVFNADGTIRSYYIASDGTVAMTSSITLQVNKMYHVIWTINSSGSHILYINGQRSASMTKVITLDTLPYFYLGKSVYSSASYPNMTIHDFRMISYYLSTTEIQSLYNWIAYTFNITDSYNVRNNIVVSSAGTGFVTMPSFTPSSTALTFSTLFICTGSTMPAQYARIFDIGDLSQAPTRGFGIRFDTSGTITPFYVASDGTVTMTSSVILQVNTMYHVVWTISSSGSHILYINGQQSATMTKVITLDTLPYFYLGKSLYSGNPYPNMKIHDFRIMNRYLSTTEIQSLYNWGVSTYITADSFNVRINTVVTTGGSGYATLPSFTPSSTGLTFSALIILTGSTMPAQWARIFDIGNTTTNGATRGFLITFNSDNTIELYYRQADGTISQAKSTIKLSLNTMYHVVWTISSSGTHILYINGEQAATMTKVITFDTLPYFYLGKSNWNDPYPNMTIFDFRMMNRYLSITEVQALYEVIELVDQSPYLAGRYIELNRPTSGWWNFSEIRVYSYPGGPNIITPSTTVTMSNSSGNPLSNFVDGDLDTIISNVGGTAGPLTVDLGSSQPIYKIVIYNRKFPESIHRAQGTVLTIKNSSNTVIYTANPMPDKLGRTSYTTDSVDSYLDYFSTFTYFPSYAAVIGDNNEDVFANVVMFDKTNIGMRIYHAENNSTKNYTSYRNALMTDTNSTNISLGQNSDSDGIIFGPNKTYGAYLKVGSGTNRITSTVAQIISTNGNLHVDCAMNGKALYLNNMSNGGGNYINSYTPWTHYNTLSIPSGSLTVSGNITTADWYYIDGAYGMYWNSYGRGFVSPEQAGNPYGHASTWGSGRNGWSGWGIGTKSCWMSNGGEFGLHDNSYSWTVYCNGGSNKWCKIGGGVEMSQNWDRMIVYFNGWDTGGGYFYVNQGGGVGHISDERIKENIRPIDRNQSIEFINGIIPSNFCLKDEEKVKHCDASGKETGYTSGVCNCEQTGFIAQNVLESARKVGLPDTTVLNAVDYEKELLLPEDQRKTMLSLNPVVIISHSVNVLKALIDNIDEQQLQIDELNRQISNTEVDMNNLQQIVNQQNQLLLQLVANI